VDVVLQRIESVNQPQAISRLVFVGVADVPAPAVHGALAPIPAQPVDSLVLTMPDADAAAFKVNQIYALSLVAKA
jgi:hypothetical protein